jgi:hypothetical protein
VVILLTELWTLAALGASFLNCAIYLIQVAIKSTLGTVVNESGLLAQSEHPTGCAGHCLRVADNIMDLMRTAGLPT